MSFPAQEIVIRQIGEDEGLLIAFVEVRKRKKEKKENIIEDITSLDPLFLIRPPKIEEKWLKTNEHRWRESGTLKEVLKEAVKEALKEAVKEEEESSASTIEEIEEVLKEAEESNTMEEEEGE